MSLELSAALLSLAPAVALLVSYPCRVWAAVVIVVASLLGGAALILSTPSVWIILSVGVAVIGSMMALWSCRRRIEINAQASADVEHMRARLRQNSAERDTVKARGLLAERDHKETVALYSVIKGLSESLSWERAQPKLEAAVENYLGVSSYALYLADGEQAAAFSTLVVRRLDGSPGSSWILWERYLREHNLSIAQALSIENPESAVAVPISDHGEILGLFYARVPSGVDPMSLLEKSVRFAGEIAFAFRRVKLYQDVEKLSVIDGLTGVYRRGTFDDRLREETVRARTFKTTFGLMLLDIDHFKQLNDRYGHPFGDAVLKRVGEVLNESVYETDFVARYGGEEFVVLLPRADPAGVLRKAEVIRQAIEAQVFTLALETIRVTASIGIAHFPRDAQSPEELIAQADAAMYAAKAQGRNCVVDRSVLRREA